MTLRHRALTVALLVASNHEPLRAAIGPAAQKLPGVFGGLVNLLAH
jgi:hypothetical protein